MQLLTFQGQVTQKAAIPIPGQPGPTRHVAAIILGSRLLNKMLGHRQLQLSLQTLPRELLALLLAEHGASSLDALYEDIGVGKLPASKVVNYLISMKEPFA